MNVEKMIDNKWIVIAEILNKLKKYAEEEGGSKVELKVKYLNLYLKKCADPTKVKITQRELGTFHKDNGGYSGREAACRTFMKNTFKPFLHEYFEIYGKDLQFEITIASGNFDKIDLIKKCDDESEIISYSVDPDKRSFRLPGKPLAVFTAAWSLGLVITVATYYFLKYFYSHRNSVNWVFAILLISISVLIILISMTLTSIVARKKYFRHAFGKTRFLTSTDEGILFASYCGICTYPNCKGKVELTNERYTEGKKRSYIGECQRNRDLHLFTFDHTSMTGKRI